MRGRAFVLATMLLYGGCSEPLAPPDAPPGDPDPPETLRSGADETDERGLSPAEARDAPLPRLVPDTDIRLDAAPPTESGRKPVDASPKSGGLPHLNDHAEPGSSAGAINRSQLQQPAGIAEEHD